MESFAEHCNVSVIKGYNVGVIAIGAQGLEIVTMQCLNDVLQELVNSVDKWQKYIASGPKIPYPTSNFSSLKFKIQKLLETVAEWQRSIEERKARLMFIESMLM